MSIQIMIGGIRFQFDSDFEIRVEKSLTSFLCIEEETADIKIKMSFSESEAVKPQAQMIGEDLLLSITARTICFYVWQKAVRENIFLQLHMMVLFQIWNAICILNRLEL